MGGRPDAGIMDAPVTIHAPKLIPWVIIEGLLIAAGALAELALTTPLVSFQCCCVPRAPRRA